MEMISERIVPALRQAVWEALNAPETLRGCIAGCEKLELVGENEYDVAMAIKIGPVAAKFKGRMTLRDIVAPDAYAIVFEGQGGMAGFAKGTASVKLAEPAEGEGTLLQYEVRAQVGGKLAQLGARLIDSSAKKMADDFFARFVKVFDPAAEAPDVAAETPPADAPAKAPGAVRSMWSRMTR
ncbi:carbon monoxide dehydrogenase subunit G [Herbaspirillum sp. RV1423]|uniref:SRPBCC family protein n=1 Tax=Herbaspirillum sp. RV1423 TaxID=1443993 RepID=UPI0004AC65E8|nr:carbon monoxide dehydrogenase subunit G [Herbaspirillum sp. RV1423]